MRTYLALSAVWAVAAVACSDSSSSSTNLCAPSGAAATVSASDNLAFSPSSVSVTVGQLVCWQNTGGMMHTVTENVVGRFNGSLPAGQTFVFTTNLTGTFAYHCNQHSNMTGTIVVNP
jgi:plastocyanin